MEPRSTEVLYDHALFADSGERISIWDAEHLRGKHSFVCPECGAPMYATFGPIQAKHFRHKGKPCAPNRYLHTNAEYTFFEEYNYCLNNHKPFYLDIELVRPCNMACVLARDVNCHERITRCHVDLTKIFRHATIEKNVVAGGQIRRPDVLLSSDDGTSLWVEIWVSHSDEAKRELGNILEIKINDYIDLESLRQHQVDSFSGKASCYIRDTNLISLFLEQVAYSHEFVYPCERYYYWEVYQTPTQKILFREFSDDYPEKRPGTLYLLVLMLNWSKGHDIRPENPYSGERLDMKRVLWFCAHKLLSCLPGAQEFMDYKLEILRKYEYVADGFSLTDEELEDMLGDM